ncbi:MAG: hydrogenase, partial [Candidatus Aminicenantes bacterium]|nr:hydrogenase [Candidatus Aminicenantes bacterium]
MVNIEDLRNEARRILKEGKVKYVIGYAKNQNGLMPVPVFVKDPEDVEKLIWDPTCIHNLAKFLSDEKKRKSKEKKPDE